MRITLWHVELISSTIVNIMSSGLSIGICSFSIISIKKVLKSSTSSSSCLMLFDPLSSPQLRCLDINCSSAISFESLVIKQSVAYKTLSARFITSPVSSMCLSNDSTALRSSSDDFLAINTSLTSSLLSKYR